MSTNFIHNGFLSNWNCHRRSRHLHSESAVQITLLDMWKDRQGKGGTITEIRKVLMRFNGWEIYYTHHHMLIVSLSSLTSVEDAIIVSLSVSLLSWQTSSHSTTTQLLKQDPKQQGKCPRSTLKRVLELAMLWCDFIQINYSSIKKAAQNCFFFCCCCYLTRCWICRIASRMKHTACNNAEPNTNPLPGAF